jgi:hypothetical protein
MSTFLVYLSLSHKSKHSCDVCLMSIWFEVAELHILILSSNLQIFYLKNCTALLQCRRSPRIGPYISFINGGLLSKAEETAILNRCLRVSHTCHLAGSKVLQFTY